VTAPVSVSLDERETRAAFTLFHPKGNIITGEMMNALSCARPHREVLVPDLERIYRIYLEVLMRTTARQRGSGPSCRSARPGGPTSSP
jgi:hypothetical protein